MIKTNYSLWGKHQPKDVWGDKYYEAEYFDAVWEHRNTWYQIATMLASDDLATRNEAKQLMEDLTTTDDYGNSSPKLPMTLTEWNFLHGH